MITLIPQKVFSNKKEFQENVAILFANVLLFNISLYFTYICEIEKQ